MTTREEALAAALRGDKCDHPPTGVEWQVCSTCAEAALAVQPPADPGPPPGLLDDAGAAFVEWYRVHHARWTWEPGSLDVRGCCPLHPEQRLASSEFGTRGVCTWPGCGYVVKLCLAPIGTKACVRPAGHPPDMHTSRSGSSIGMARR